MIRDFGGSGSVFEGNFPSVKTRKSDLLFDFCSTVNKYLSNYTLAYFFVPRSSGKGFLSSTVFHKHVLFFGLYHILLGCSSLLRKILLVNAHLSMGLSSFFNVYMIKDAFIIQIVTVKRFVEYVGRLNNNL